MKAPPSHEIVGRVMPGAQRLIERMQDASRLLVQGARWRRSPPVQHLIGPLALWFGEAKDFFGPNGLDGLYDPNDQRAQKTSILRIMGLRRRSARSDC